MGVILKIDLYGSNSHSNFQFPLYMVSVGTSVLHYIRNDDRSRFVLCTVCKVNVDTSMWHCQHCANDQDRSRFVTCGL